MLAQCAEKHGPIEIGDNLLLLRKMKCGTCGGPLLADAMKPFMSKTEYERLIPFIKQSALLASEEIKEILDSEDRPNGDPLMKVLFLAVNLVFSDIFLRRLESLTTGTDYVPPPKPPGINLTKDTAIPRL